MEGGKVGGSGWPCSFSLISFMAIENSCISILPSLFISARALKYRKAFSKTGLWLLSMFT